MDQDGVYTGIEKRWMPIEDQNKIRKNWVYLKFNLRNHVDLIKDSFFAKFVIDAIDKEKIEETEKEDKNAALEQLLDKLIRYGSFETFINCLKENGFVDVVKKLCEGENEEVVVKTGNEREIRVVVIGKTGAGKSALGNSLLNLKGGETFISQSSPSSVTQTNLLKERVVHTEDGNISLKLLDTPGLSDTRKSNTETAKELVKCIVDLNPGPHIFIFVLKLDRIGEDIMNNIQFLKDTFGSCLETYGIIVFTGKDTLDVEFNVWLKSGNEEFKQFLSHYCKGRYALINNREGDHKKKEQQVRDIIQLVLGTIQSNNGDFYRNEMYEEAKKVYEEKLIQLEEAQTRVETELKEHLKSMEDENETLKQHLEQQKRTTDDLQQKNKELKQLTDELKRIKNESEETRKKNEQLTKQLEKQNDELKRRQNWSNAKGVRLYSLVAEEEPDQDVQNTQQNTNSNLKIVDSLIHEEVPTRKRKQSGNTQQTSENQMEMAVPAISPDVDIEDKTNQEAAKIYKPLHSPCRYGTLETVQHLIDIGADVNETDRRNMTPLLHCSQSLIDPVDKIQLLMSRGADMHHRDVNDDTILHHACISGKLETVKYLICDIDRPMDVNSTNLKRATPLFFCCQSQTEAIKKIELLEKHGANKDQMDINNDKIIHVACKNGELETVKYLIENLKIDVNSRGFNNQTPLMNCILSSISPLDKVKFLRSKEADFDCVDNTYRSNALHLACSLGTVEVVDYLKDIIDVNSKSYRDRTPIFYCVESTKEPIAKIKGILSKGAEFNVVDSQNVTAFEHACLHGAMETVQYMIQLSSDTNTSDKMLTSSSLFSCSESSIKPVDKIKLLQSMNVNIKDRDKNNGSILHHACKLGMAETVEYLLGHFSELSDEEYKLLIEFCKRSKFNSLEKVNLLTKQLPRK